MDVPVHLRILGPLRVWRDNAEVDAGPHQQQCLLALLLAHEGNPVSVAELTDLLWGAHAPPSAVNIIHKYVGALRRLLEPGLPPRATGAFIARQGNGYRFTAAPGGLDLLRFRQLVAQAKARAGRGELDAALDHYTEALRLGRGHAGDGLAGTPAARTTFAGLDGEFLDAVLAAADVAGRLGRPGRLLAPLRRAAEMDPLNELIHASVMTALAAAGHQAEALGVYRAIRGRLADDLGIDPGPDLQEAFRQVLGQNVRRPAAGGPRPAQLPAGLRFFTGRQDELATLGRLSDEPGPRVIALHGPAGVGKSALAVHFARTVAGGFGDGQLHLDLRGAEPLRSLLHGLGVPGHEIPDTDGAQVGLFRSLTATGRVLILLDDARDADQVRPLLPASPASLVLITSRHPLVELAARDGAHLLHVGRPGLHDARELLRRHLSGLPQQPLDEIVERHGRLPSALALHAAHLRAGPGR
ncbi:BTAD domain-containing putative transcriptional regulator [Actinoplanes sp. HUAS TT8]|uniref:AfsR/SARP family transcriptional regulator n=1 Tax=Actinoplanes sp. HUAS TT8 TaxID=3447453 RepID=UPI003F52719B